MFDASKRAFSVELLSNGTPVAGGNFTNFFAAFYDPLDVPVLLAPVAGTGVASTFFTGTSDSGSLVTIYNASGGILGTGFASASGEFTIGPVTLSTGTYNFTPVATLSGQVQTGVVVGPYIVTGPSDTTPPVLTLTTVST